MLSERREHYARRSQRRNSRERCGPAKASGDAGSVEQHKLTEQIAADKHLAGKNAVRKPHRGFASTRSCRRRLADLSSCDSQSRSQGCRGRQQETARMLKRLSGIIEQLRGGAARSPSASGRSPRQPFFSRLRAKYDAANTTLDNIKHWSRADGLSAAAANSPDVRRTLRNRSRYEVANNSYARGITLTLANDVVGTGPRLQMLTADDAANRFVEAEFFAWCRGDWTCRKAANDAAGSRCRW